MSNLVIDLMKDLRPQLASLPFDVFMAYEEVTNKKQDLDEAQQKLDDYSYNLSADISLNPEKYGFPLGDKPERFRVLARVHSSPEYRKLHRRVLHQDYQHRKAVAKLECLKMKFEALKCLING